MIGIQLAGVILCILQLHVFATLAFDGALANVLRHGASLVLAMYVTEMRPVVGRANRVLDKVWEFADDLSRPC